MYFVCPNMLFDVAFGGGKVFIDDSCDFSVVLAQMKDFIKEVEGCGPQSMPDIPVTTKEMKALMPK